jgi:hypothetical protein
MGLLVAVALISFALQSACKGPYDAAWRTLDSVQKAKALTAQQLGASAEAKHKDCVKQHGSQTAEFASCIKAHREAIKQWRDNVRPAVNSAVNITATAVQIAEKAKSDPKLDWMSLLKPAACSLLRVAKAWGHYYADKGAALLSALRAFEGVICE